MRAYVLLRPTSFELLVLSKVQYLHVVCSRYSITYGRSYDAQDTASSVLAATHCCLCRFFFCCEGLPLVMNQSCHTHPIPTHLYISISKSSVPHFRHTHTPTLRVYTLSFTSSTHTQVLVPAACPQEPQLSSQTASHHTASEDAIQHWLPHQDPGPGAWDGNRHLNTIGSWRPGCFLAVCFSEGRGLACSIRRSFPVSSDPFSLHSLPG